MPYELNQIIGFVNGIVDLSKDTEAAAIRKLLKRKLYDKEKELDYPEFFSFYKEACQMRDHIKYHAEKCDFPEMLYRKKAPRMSDEEFDYIRENFKQVSLPVYLDFHATVQRGFNDTSWSVSFPKAAEKPTNGYEYSFREYVEKNLPEFGSYESFMKFYLPHLKLTDPVGCVAIRPKEFYFRDATEEEINSDPNITADTKFRDNSKSFEPRPFYFRCDQLKGFKNNEYFIFESDERSEVQYGNKTEKIGRVFEYYDKEKIVFIKQVGKYTDYKFIAIVMVEHNWKRIPVMFNGGVPKITKDGTMHVSPFYYAVDLLDLVLLNETNLQCAINNSVFPYRIVEGNECDFEYEDREGNKIPCDDGWIHDILLDARFRCPSCAGSGLKSNMGPMGVMIIKQMTSLDQQTSSSRLRDPMMFVSPPMDSLEFLMKKKESDEMKARNILHLQDSSSSVQPTQDMNSPALKTALDLKGLYAFLKMILDQVFDHLVFYYEATAMFMYGVESYKEYVPSVAYPVAYDFKTEGDYLAEIAAATQSNLPPFVIHTIIYRYISALYFNDPRTASIFLLLVSTDRLLIFSSDAIEAKQGKGLVEDWEIILHDSGLSLIDQLASDNKDFFDDKKNPFDKRKQQLIAKAKALAAIIKLQITADRQAEQASQVSEIMSQTSGSGKTDSIGKIPLALQQLALAKERANNAGDTQLASDIAIQMTALLKQLTSGDGAPAEGGNN